MCNAGEGRQEGRKEEWEEGKEGRERGGACQWLVGLLLKEKEMEMDRKS